METFNYATHKPLARQDRTGITGSRHPGFTSLHILLEPFDSVGEAKDFWNETSSAIIILGMLNCTEK